MQNDVGNATVAQSGCKFIENQICKYLYCPLCFQLMIQPMRIHPCGHTFCNKCISKQNNSIHSSPKRKCPIELCQRKYSIIQPDRTAQSLIDELKVACANKGCVWKGDYDTYKKTHKQRCVLKQGLETWLSELTKGIVMTTRQSAKIFENAESKVIPNRQEQEQHQQQNKQNLSNGLEISLQKEQNQQKSKNPQNVNQQKQNIQLKQEHNSITKRRESSSRKKKVPPISQILDPRFVLNYQDHLNESQMRKKYLKKQLKKIQS